MSEVANKRREKARAKVSKAAWHNNEPPFNVLDYRTSLLKSLCFYNNEIESKDKQDWALSYWKTQGKNISHLRKLNPVYFNQAGALVRLLERDIILEPEHFDYLSNKYNELTRISKNEEKTELEKQAREQNQPKKPTIQDHMTAQAATLIEEIDGFLDEIIKDGKTSIEIGKWIKQRRIPAAVAKKISTYFEFSSTDIQTQDGYPTGRKYTNLKNFYDELNASLEVVRAAKIQKVRIKKQKPPGELVKGLFYLKESEGLTSVIPAKIIGAKEVYLFNVERRKLSKLVALDGMTLSVKGTTIINVDQDLSQTKTVRKPEVLKSAKTLGIREMRTIFKDINAVTRPASGRTSDKIIILAVY